MSAIKSLCNKMRLTTQSQLRVFAQDFRCKNLSNSVVSGFSANIALKRLSLRQVGLIGAGIYTLASFLAIFVESTAQLIITNGLLQGLGMGLLIPVSYTSFNSYFTKKKVLYLSLCKASIGLITMVYPLFIKMTMAEYGFRGTLAIICAISAHSIFGAIVLHPVEWYMVKQPKTCEQIVRKYTYKLLIIMH